MKYDDLIPMLNVGNIDASLRFYEEKLGFKRVSSDKQLQDWRWARVVCGDIDFMLMETKEDLNIPKGCDAHTNRSWPAQLYFHLEGVEGLHEALAKQGCVVSALRQTKHGLLEFSMQDLDGHMLSFGRDLLDEDDNLIM